MKPLISILITNYNKEKYISYVLTMLLQQNNSKIEIILIDDGSTDSSIRIIEQVLEEFNDCKQDNLKIIYHKENKGVAATKQEALDLSCGQFFIYIDSDDFIVEDYVETLIKYAESNESLIYQFQTRIYPYGGTVKYSFSLWDKLFNKKIIKENNLHFNIELKNMDDVDFWDRAVNQNPDIQNQIKSVKKVLYYYNVLSSNTLTHINPLWYGSPDDLKEECK